MPPFSSDPEDRAPPLSCVAKRVTMDFSLLSAPLPDPPQDSDGDNVKSVDGNHEETLLIQVLSLTFVTFSACGFRPGIVQI